MQPHIKGRLTIWLSCFFALIFLAATTVRAQSGHDLTGTIKDSSGAAVAQASISLLNARQSAVASTHTDAQGQFTLHNVAAGAYELLVSGKGFERRSRAVSLPRDSSSLIEFNLGIAALTAEVTVTAEVGTVQSLDETTQQVNVIGEEKLQQRAASV
ncbi:MAG: carboxypeptidase regulatory-like domain-containing protein, partial [Acidobacteria bacterium]|nr:carboxypeptidase regulatory-like domain-containing protein [Acidobacteriota bacterium]